MTTGYISDSIIGVTAAEILTLPICTVKTNYQNTESTSINQTIKQIYQTNGIRGFYRASVPAIFSQTISLSVKYVLYQVLVDKATKQYQHIGLGHRMCIGLITGISASLFTHPIDVVKIHLQMSTAIIPEVRKFGLTIFYRGYSKALNKVCVGSCLFLPLFDQFKQYAQSNVIVAAAASAIISTVIMHPLDYLKTRHIYGLPFYAGFNPRTYYKGITLNLLRVVPHFVIVMVIIDCLQRKRLIKQIAQ